MPDKEHLHAQILIDKAKRAAHTAARLPVELDVVDLARLVDEGEGVHAKALHVAVIGRHAHIIHQECELDPAVSDSANCLHAALPHLAVQDQGKKSISLETPRLHRQFNFTEITEQLLYRHAS